MHSLKNTLLILFLLFSPLCIHAQVKATKTLAYIVSDLKIPFWSIMERGILSKAQELGYKIQTYSSENSAKKELESTIKAIRDKVDGIIISPTNSSACVTILHLAKNANIPVVIADIGTDAGEYVSYISSNNKEGAYGIGKILAAYLYEKEWQNGRVGIIAIPQKRLNGQQRTAGFMKALEEVGIRAAGIKQQVDFSYKETYELTKKMILENPDLRAIWLQGSDKYKGAQDAIYDFGRKDEIALLCFDAEPEFIEMINKEELVVLGMQQSFLIGESAIQAMDEHLHGKVVQKNIEFPILVIHKQNIQEQLPTIKRYVLGQDF